LAIPPWGINLGTMAPIEMALHCADNNRHCNRERNFFTRSNKKNKKMDRNTLDKEETKAY